MWYTDHSRGYLGRFDPATGDVQEWPSPSGLDSRPYGIAAVGTVVWYSESGIRDDTLVRFDTETEEFQGRGFSLSDPDGYMIRILNWKK